MPWGLAAAAVTAGAGAYSASSAKDAQQNAADQAAATQAANLAQTRNDTQGYRDAGTSAVANLTNLAGQYNTPLTAAQVMAKPGYQFGLQQGNDNLQGQAATQGGLYSGNALKALNRYGDNYATKNYDDAFNQQQTEQNANFGRYNTIAQTGLNATNIADNAGANAANQTSNIQTSNGNAQAAGDIAIGNSIANGVNQGASWYTNTPSSVSYTKPNADGTYNNPTNNGYQWATDPAEAARPRGGFAEGGPVLANRLREPVVGSRSPLPEGGTGGGLSKNALLQLVVDNTLAQQPRPPVPVRQLPPSGMGLLPGNPVTDPGGVLARQMQQQGLKAGGPVRGPGGPKSDSIPAMLSNGEHVMDTATVNAIGGGNNAAGQNKLNLLRKQVKKGRR